MIEELRRELEALKGTFGERTLSPALQRGDGTVEFRGKVLLDFTNWDFLALSKNHAVTRVFQQNAELNGVGSASSRVTTGTGPEHLAAEKSLARFLGVEDALLFSSRNQAVFTLLANILNERDVVFFDEGFQGPAQDAAYLVNAAAIAVPCANPEQLAVELAKAKGYRRKLLILEAVSPITGALVDIAAVSAAATRGGVEVILDQSCKLGIAGILGAPTDGVVAVPPFVQIGDLASLGLCGGFIAGPETVLSYLVHRSRAFALEAPLPRPFAAALAQIIETVELAHGGREQLALKSALFHNRLLAGMIPLASSSSTPIVSVQFTKPSAAHEFCTALFSRGVLAEVILKPGLVQEHSFCRFLVNLSHSDRQIEDAAAVVIELFGRVQKA